MSNNREILVPDRFYHIYNRAIADGKLFTSDQEYNMFLKKYFCYSKSIFKTYGYCLLPNHFHFLIQVSSESELNHNLGIFKDDKSRSNYLAQHLGNFFNWYATIYNKSHSRKGSLFIHSFQRKPISDQQYLIKLLCYIHFNPIKAGLRNSFEGWKYSSYSELLGSHGFLSPKNKHQTLYWFDGVENFKEVHKEYMMRFK